MKKLFDVLKKLFNVTNVEEISDEMMENYYAETEKTETADEEKTEETVEEEKVEEEVKEEEVVENAEPEKPVEEEKAETKVEETKPEETVKEEKKDDVITEDVLNKSILTEKKVFDKDYLNDVHGDEFFKLLKSNPKAVIEAYK